VNNNNEQRIRVIGRTRRAARRLCVASFLAFTLVTTTLCSEPKTSVFSRQNMTAWCVVPFDAKQRNPQQRAEMLRRLGIKNLAYDWRDVHIPQFDEEVAQLKKHGIRMTAFWWVGGFPSSEEELRASEKMNMQIDFLKRNSLNLDVWVTLSDHGLESATDDEKYTELARRIDILARELKTINCRVGLYNHGGWGGHPYNMVETIKKVKSDNVGIVYNFHHGHEHLDVMPGAFNMMLPYLYCVNLNGMNKNGPKILPFGQGTEDMKIIKMIAESGYNGPIGIIGHIENEDVEVVLQRNIEGLKKLLEKLGDKDALETFMDK
jgi:sugar phosphate isomerase/epimerase